MLHQVRGGIQVKQSESTAVTCFTFTLCVLALGDCSVDKLPVRWGRSAVSDTSLDQGNFLEMHNKMDDVWNTL